MSPEKRYPFLVPLLSTLSDKRHRTVMGLFIAAIAVTGQARSIAIATTVARWLGTRLDSALNRFYRLLRNHRVEYLEFTAQWARLLVRGPGRHLTIAIDWTEWHSDLRLLVAGVVVGKRGIPLFVQGFEKQVRMRSQNQRENTFLRVLADVLRRAEVTTTIVCDRGFRRVSWLKLLQQLNLGFVVRLMDDVFVEAAPELRLALRHILLTQGEILDLGQVPLRSDAAVTVRVIGYWAPGRHEPWWLATNETGSAAQILKAYDRRMTVEEMFRDSKGKRFGVKLVWTQFTDPEALARFCTLLAVALLIWTLAGRAAAAKSPSLRLHSKSKGPRQSFVTIGLRICTLEKIPIAMTARSIARWLEAPTLRRLGKFSLGGK